MNYSICCSCRNPARMLMTLIAIVIGPMMLFVTSGQIYASAQKQPLPHASTALLFSTEPPGLSRSPIALNTLDKHIVVYVKSGDEEEAVPDMLIRANRRDQPGEVEGRTNSKGKVELDVNSGEWEVTVDLYRDDGHWFTDEPYKVVRFADDDSEETKEVLFTVKRPKATIRGQLVDADGAPLNIANMYAFSVSAYSNNGYQNRVHVTEEGYFENTLIAGSYEVTIFVDQHLAPELYAPDPFIIQVVDNQTLDLGKIRLGRKNSIIRGRVLDDNGEPQVGVTVSAWRSGSSGGWSKATTNASGEYSATVRAGDWKVTVEQNHPPTYFVNAPPQRVEVGDGESVVVDLFVLAPAGTITGSITDPDGTLLTNINATAYARRVSTDTVGVVEYSTFYWIGVMVESPVHGGQFELNVPVGTYQVGLHLYANKEYSFFDEEETNIDRMSDLIAAQRGSLRTSNLQGNSQGDSAVVNGGRLIGEQLVTVMDHPTSIELTASMVQTRDLQVTDDAEVTIVLRRNDATISGTLRNLDGTAAIGINGEVYAWADGLGGPQQSSSIDTQTGTYELSVTGTDWHIGYYLHTSDYVPYRTEPISVSVGSEEAVIQDITLLPLDATIRGTLLDPDGKPMNHAYVWANHVEEVAEEYYYGSSGEAIDGHFEFKVVSGQAYQVGAYGPLHLGYLQPELQSVTPQVNDVSEVTLQFVRPNATINGTVYQSNTHEPAQNAYIYAWSDDGHHVSVKSGSNGQYMLSVVRDTIWNVGATWSPSNEPGNYHTLKDLRVDLISSNASADLRVELDLQSLPPAVVTIFDVGQAWTEILGDGTRIDIPAGAIPVADRNGRDVTLTITPLTADLPGTLSAQPLNYGYAIHAYSWHSGEQVTQNFNSNVTLTFYYTDEELDELGITESDIAPAYFSTTSNRWILIESFTVDPDENKITAQISHFSNWALVSVANAADHVPTDLTFIYLPLTAK